MIHGRRIIIGTEGTGKTRRLGQLVARDLLLGRRVFLVMRREEAVPEQLLRMAPGGIYLRPLDDFFGLTACHALFTNAKLVVATVDAMLPAAENGPVLTDLLEELSRLHLFAPCPSANETSHAVHPGFLRKTGQFQLNLDAAESCCTAETLSWLPDNTTLACRSLAGLDALLGIEQSDQFVEGFHSWELFRLADVRTVEKGVELSCGALDRCGLMELKRGCSRLIARHVFSFGE
jgi:hypothetical protein